MKTHAFIYTLLSFLLFSFKLNGNTDQQNNAGPSANKAFGIIVLNIPNKGIITSYHTERVEDGQVINFSPAPLMAEGSYPLLTDAEANLTDKRGKEFYFVGYGYGQEIIRERYTIVNDHGHVVLVKGNSNIKLKPGC